MLELRFETNNNRPGRLQCWPDQTITSQNEMLFVS